MYDARQHGADCDHCPFNGQPLVPPKLVVGGRVRLVILAESPGKDEVIRKEPLIGRTGAVVDAALAKLHIPGGQCHKTNAMLCLPLRDAGAREYSAAVAACRPRLLRELDTEAGGIAVAAMGKWALAALTGRRHINDWMGAPMDGGRFDVKGRRSQAKKVALDASHVRLLPMFHPAFLFRQPHYTPVFLKHFDRAWALVRGKLAPWEWPEIVTEPGPQMVRALKRLLRANELMGVDVETAGLGINEDLLDIGVATPWLAVSVPWYRLGKHAPEVKLLRKLLTRVGAKCVYQNGQFDVSVLVTNGWPLESLLASWVSDTLLAHHVLAPDLGHRLEFQAGVEFHVPKWKTEFRSASDAAGTNRYVSADPTERAIYNARDCILTVLLMQKYQSMLKTSLRGEEHFARYMNLTKIGTRMRLWGLEVNKRAVRVHKKELTARVEGALRIIRPMARAMKMPDYNPDASAHVRTMFAEKFGCVSTKRSKKTGKPSYNAKVLLEISVGDNLVAAKFAQAQLTYRRFKKLLSTYVQNLPYHVEGSSWVVHASVNVTGARTGRFSYSDPNLQNIAKPKVTKDGKLITPGMRDLFKARKGMWLVECDYKALEALIIAQLAKDEKLLQWFADGVDVHVNTAMAIFGRATREEVTEKERDLSKRVRYGIANQGSAKTIWANLVPEYPTLTETAVARVLAGFYKLHPAIYRWQQEQYRFARVNGYIEEPLTGWRKTFMGNLVEITKVCLTVQMMAAAIINQGLAAFMVKGLKKGEKVLIQVHDSIVCEGPDAQDLGRRMKKHLTQEITVDGVTCTYPVDVKIGRDWGHMEKVKV